MFVPNTQLDQWIEEDVPGFDLTSHLLSMEKYQARLEFQTRDETIICGSEEASAVFKRLGAEVERCLSSGRLLSTGECFMTVEGNAAALHAGWRVALNLLEYASGIATRTAQMVRACGDHGHAIVCGTRKAFPGGRKISQKALITGGGVQHRMGLGETILIFPNHYNLVGLDVILSQMYNYKQRAPEKKIGVEVDSLEQAKLAAEADVDIVQLDKFSISQVEQVVALLKPDYPRLCIAAAGGINVGNAAEYAATGADILVTSSMYFGKPADISAKMIRCD